MLHQYPANAPPLQVMLDLVGDESETAVILLQSNALVEVGATFELAQPQSAQDAHVVAELRSTVRKRLESEAGSSTAVPRTAGELRGRARAIGLCRERIEANKASEERRRQIEAAESRGHQARSAQPRPLRLSQRQNTGAKHAGAQTAGRDRGRPPLTTRSPFAVQFPCSC